MSAAAPRRGTAALLAVVCLLAALLAVAAPDGRSASAAPAAGTLLYLRSTDGGFSRQLFVSEDGRERRLSAARAEGRFALSPDGGEVVFAGPPGGDDSFGRYGLHRANLTTGAVRQVTDPRYADRDPAWSPDGGRLAFRRAVSGAFTSPDHALLVTSDAEGRGATAVPGTGGGADPAWSPDGSRLAYVTSAGLWTVRPDGGERTLLRRGSYAEPDWAPDGGRIAVVDRASPTSSSVLVVAVQGQGFARPAELAGVVEDPTWSADGSSITFVRGTGTGVQGRSRGEVWSTAPSPGAPATQLLVPPTVPHHLAVVTSLGDPLGSLDAVARVPGGVRVAGWVVDPADVPAQASARVTLNGRVTSLPASLPRPDVVAGPGAGDRHGFDAVLPAGPEGPFILCVDAVSVDGARSSRLGCDVVATRAVRYGPAG